MISDFLARVGIESYHLMPRTRQRNKVRFVDGHRVKEHSGSLGNRLERYEPEILASWDEVVPLVEGFTCPRLRRSPEG